MANQERVLAAAVTTMLREGRQVPMAAIAAEAGVGVGTLYRHYPTRDALLMALTERSFGLVQALAERAEQLDGSAIRALEHYLDATIEQRDQLVLPLHGGPTTLSGPARRLRSQTHAAIGRILERGRADGTVRADVVALDVVIFGALLAQSLADGASWLSSLRRQKLIFLAGLAPAPAPLPTPPPTPPPAS